MILVSFRGDIVKTPNKKLSSYMPKIFSKCITIKKAYYSNVLTNKSSAQ